MEYVVKRTAGPEWEKAAKAALVHQPWLKACPVSAWAQALLCDDRLYIRMEAAERPIRAEHRGLLDQICEDSCLEFFFAPDVNDERYFNFEWNPNGALYLGFGAARPTRVRQIVKDAPALFRPETFFTADGWGITFSIPEHYIGLYFPGFRFEGSAAANFYKCGDLTEHPHYLAWASPDSDTPDFHLRRDFGKLIFE